MDFGFDDDGIANEWAKQVITQDYFLFVVVFVFVCGESCTFAQKPSYSRSHFLSILLCSFLIIIIETGTS